MPEPKKITKEEGKAIATDAVRRFGNQEWFRDVAIYNAHPTDGMPCVEFKVNHIPVFVQKEILAFANENNMKHRFVVVDKDGNPTQ